MRNFLFMAAFSLIFITANAQITVSSTGKVGINQVSPDYNLDWYGTGRFWSGWGQLIFDSCGINGTVNLHPGEDWVGGLGTSNKKFNDIYTYKLYYDQLEDWSDERLKENIKPLESCLAKVRQLNGVSYNMKKEFYNISDQELLRQVMHANKNDFGFIAQEVKEVLPEIVSLDPTSELYTINYVKLIPVLVEAIKEQQAEIELLKQQIGK